MGGPMSAHVAAAGYALQSFDPNRKGNRRSNT